MHRWNCQHWNLEAGYGTHAQPWLVRRAEVSAGTRDMARERGARHFGCPASEVVVKYLGTPRMVSLPEARHHETKRRRVTA